MKGNLPHSHFHIFGKVRPITYFPWNIANNLQHDRYSTKLSVIPRIMIRPQVGNIVTILEDMDLMVNTALPPDLGSI